MNSSDKQKIAQQQKQASAPGMNSSRREFLRRSGIVGGGLVLGVSLSGCGSPPPGLTSNGRDFVPNAFLQITEDSEIIFHNPRDEMGQGVYMGLTTLVAEELNTPPNQIGVVMVGAHPDYAAPSSGAQVTGGSSSIRDHYLPLRQAGANARELLLLAASQSLLVPRAELSLKDGLIHHGSEVHPIGQFAAIADQLSLERDAPLKPKEQFRFIGKSLPRIDAIAKSTGTAMYGIDAELEGLHRAAVRHSPIPGGEVISFDASDAKTVAGVVDVIEIHSGVAVVANGYWAAKKAAALLNIEWSKPTPLANISSADIRADYSTLMAADGADVHTTKGEAQADISSAHEVSAEYWTPYLSHSPMEPMNAVVHIQGNRAEAWAGNQSPTAVQSMVTRHADIDADKVTVHGVFSGGGFGRRAYMSHVGEAAALAKITGLPIQVTWSRESDTKDGWFRPASLVRIDAGLSDTGVIDSWRAKRVGANLTPNIIREILPMVAPSTPQGLVNAIGTVADKAHDGWIVDHASIEGLYEDYDWPNIHVSHATKDHGVPTTFWRSVGHSFTAFAKECAVDELALKAGVDPVALRLSNCNNNPRLAEVIRQAGAVYAAGPSASGHHLGFAAHSSFKSYVAQVAEVSVTKGKIRVHKVSCVVDCGVAVNPDIVRDQMSGAIMFGLTAAMHGKIEIENGEVRQSNFHDYPILRMNEAPEVEVIIVESSEAPTGVGEPGLPPVAPAVANAVFRASGQRLRELPLKLS